MQMMPDVLVDELVNNGNLLSCDPAALAERHRYGKVQRRNENEHDVSRAE